MPVIGHTHDEIVTEPEEKDSEDAGLLLEHIMGDWRPEWRADLPLVAEIKTNWWYTKSLD